MKSGEEFSGGKSKTQRYKWTVKDELGKFQMIDKRLLNVDHSYQRDTVSETRVLRIASNWSWKAFKVICVAVRPDGTYWVFDGQHRKLAADKREDIVELPCMVYPALPNEEAQAFLDTNTTSTAVWSVDKFKAQVAVGDPIAMAVKAMVEAAGYRVTRSSGSFTVGCIASIMSDFKIDPDAARAAWRVCVEIHAGEQIVDRLWLGIAYLERLLRRRKDLHNLTLESAHNRKSLLEAGRERILAKIASAQGFYAKGGPKVYASGIIQILNHKRSTRRIGDVFGSNDADVADSANPSGENS
jgi:hypothetical protein